MAQSCKYITKIEKLPFIGYPLHY